VFLGCAAANSLIRHCDLNSKRIKTAFHADHDEAHCTSSSRPPGPQLLHDLGLREVERATVPADADADTPAVPAATHPPLDKRMPKKVDTAPCQMHPPLAEFSSLTSPPAAAAARLTAAPPFDPGHSALTMSDDPLAKSFSETLPIGGEDPAAGLALEKEESAGRIKLIDCRKGAPTARIPRWRSRLRHAHLLTLDGKPVNSVEDAVQSISQARNFGQPHSVARFAFNEMRDALTDDGVPQLHHDQLNVVHQHLADVAIARSAEAKQKLTRRCLRTLPEWEEWEASEFKLLNQCHKQNVFGDPVRAPPGAAIFEWVWDHREKLDADKTKKARGVCNGSPRAGKVRSAAPTYAACVDQTRSRIFHASCALEGKLVLNRWTKDLTVGVFGNLSDNSLPL